MNLFIAQAIACLLLSQNATAEPPAAQVDAKSTPAAVKAAFLKMLDRPKVALDVQSEPPTTDPKTGEVVQRLSFASELKVDGATERVPALIVKAASADGQPARRPAVILLHGTGGNKDGMRPWLNAFAKRGYIALAIDARYHGERSGGAKGSAAYVEAITRAWRVKSGMPQEHPFYYDTCWDLWRTLDYLETRDDVDPTRIGMLGISMGGIETWLAAAVDDRVKVAVPAISVQSFEWSLSHDLWQGRANTIKAAHEAAARDLNEERVNAQVCRTLWDKVIPGILGPFDCPSMIRLFAGRSLLILNGEKDLNCPIEGARLAIDSAQAAFREAGANDHLKVIIASGVGHAVTDAQKAEALDWFDRWLKP